MNTTRNSGRNYSLQRRIQVLAAVSLIIAGFVLLTGTIFLDHWLNHDKVAEASRYAMRLVEDTNVNPADASEADKKELASILEANPGAWYYFESDSQVVSSTPDAPRYKEVLVGSNPELFVSESGEGSCNLYPAEFRFDAGDGNAAVRLVGCGTDAYYVEVAGFDHGQPLMSHLVSLLRAQYFGESVKDTILPIAIMALLTIAAVTFLFGTMMRRIEAVSGAASLIGKGKHHVLLPENNLPKEILPMVEAINRAINRLEEASEQQGLFVAAAAHELRTPLTVFRTRLEQMDESELKEELIGDMRRVDSMVTQLLALAKLGSAELDLEKLDLADVVRTTCQERGGAVFVAGKELSFDASGKAAGVLGDRESVKTAVANLIDNALMFTPEGSSVEVHVDGNRVTITDEGPGVAPESRERIFEPFFKNPPNKPGHGLGLAIVAEIMRIHEGSVDTRSSDAGGAVFELTFKEAT